MYATSVRMGQIGAIIFICGCGFSPAPSEVPAKNAASKKEIELSKEAIPPADSPESLPDKRVVEENEVAGRRSSNASPIVIPAIEGVWVAEITEASSDEELSKDIEEVISSRRDESISEPDRWRKKDGTIESEEEAQQRREQTRLRHERDKRRRNEARTSKVEVAQGKLNIELFSAEGFGQGEFKELVEDGFVQGVQATLSHADGRVRKVTIGGPYDKRILDGTIREEHPEGKSLNWMILGSRLQDR